MEYSNFTEMMNTSWEPITHEFIWLPVDWTWWLICQLILAVVGLLGNLVVIIIYTRRNRLKSATNLFIVALAVSDFISSVSLIPLPKAIQTSDTFIGRFYCRIISSDNILWNSIVSSIFTLTAISVERYFAVVFPIKYRNFFTKSRPKFVILAIWISSYLINAFGIYVTYRDPASGSCIVDFRTPLLQKTLGTFLFLVEYFIPMVIMISTQLITINRLRQQAQVGARNQGPGKKERENAFMMKARKKVIKMLFLVILTFITCWTPDQVAFLVFNLGYVEPQYLGGNLYRIFIALAFTNSCANPYIYAASNPQFRDAFRELLHLKKRRIFPFTFGGSGNTENTSVEPTLPTGVDALEAQGGTIG